MNNCMMRYQAIILKWLFKKLVKQGYYHKDNITQIMRLLHEACANEFKEEHDIHIGQLITDCYIDALVKDVPPKQKDLCTGSFCYCINKWKETR